MPSENRNTGLDRERERPLQLKAGHTVEAKRMDKRMGSEVGLSTGLGYKRQRFSAKQRERESRSRQHFDLAACRQLLMLAYVALGGLARDTEMEGS